MSGGESDVLGAFIQEYAAARWGRTPDRSAAAELGSRLDRKTRDRVDVLGGDAERLLAVEVDQVIHELEKLEAEAVLEDARAQSGAAARQPADGHRVRQPAPDPGVRHPGIAKHRPNRMGRRRGAG